MADAGVDHDRGMCRDGDPRRHTVTGFRPVVVAAIMARAANQCEIGAAGCTVHVDTIHHRRPRAMGGTRRPDTNWCSNGLATCRDCHAYVESHRDWARKWGFVVAQWGDPAATAVWWRCIIDADQAVMVYLADDGRICPAIDHAGG